MKPALKNRTFFLFALFFLCLFQWRPACHEVDPCGDGDFSIEGGNLKATLHRKTGTFSFYKLRPAGKNAYDPLLDTRNYGAGSRFSVSAGGKTHLLGARAFKKIGFEASEDGKSALFVFEPSDDFQARQRFSIEENTAFGQAAFVLAIETTIENTSGKDMAFGLRAVFDTMLGERRSSGRGHFTTDTGQAIASETILSPSASGPRVLFSSNGERTFALSLSGGALQSSPDFVYIANWHRCDSLLKGSFRRAVGYVEGRSLSSVYAQNDSAVLMNWPEVTLRDGEKASVTVFVSAANPGQAASRTSGLELARSIVPSGRREDEGSPLPANGGENEASSLFREKQALYFRIRERLRQIERGDVEAEMGEIYELNRILDILLEDVE